MMSFPGAVKLTPAHSSVDYQIAVKHNLRHINILSDDGTLCNCGEVFDVRVILYIHQDWKNDLI